jgi:hypothetical protein
MDTQTMLEALKSKFWGNKYFCKSEVLNQIRACLEIDNHLKASETPKTDPMYQELDKEMMDLKIMLDFYLSDNPELYEKRVEKFYSKLEK